MSNVEPLASRAIRRVTEYAEALGLVCVPQVYTLRPQPPGSDIATWQLDTDPGQGPLVVTDVFPPFGALTANATMRLRTGSRYLTEGRVRVADAFDVPRDYIGQLLDTPICVNAGDTLAIELRLPAGQSWTAEVLRLSVLGIRQPTSARLLSSPSVDLGAQWLRRCSDDGEWWASGVVTDGTAYISVSDDVVIETLVIGAETVGEGDIGPSSAVIQIGEHYVTPQGIALPYDFVTGVAYALPGLRMPVPSTTRLRVELTYPPGVGDRVPARVLALGRRGGIARDCWR